MTATRPPPSVIRLVHYLDEGGAVLFKDLLFEGRDGELMHGLTFTTKDRVLQNFATGCTALQACIDEPIARAVTDGINCPLYENGQIHRVRIAQTLYGIRYEPYEVLATEWDGFDDDRGFETVDTRASPAR